MASVTEAILALDPNCQFELKQKVEPTSAQSFDQCFRLVALMLTKAVTALRKGPQSLGKIMGILLRALADRELTNLNNAETIEAVARRA